MKNFFKHILKEKFYLKKKKLIINLPIISNAAVKCEVGGPAKPVAPKAAPPNAQATPPNATTAINARSGGPANH